MQSELLGKWELSNNMLAKKTSKFHGPLVRNLWQHSRLDLSNAHF